MENLLWQVCKVTGGEILKNKNSKSMMMISLSSRVEESKKDPLVKSMGLPGVTSTGYAE
jgi:hypothetical protein